MKKYIYKIINNINNKIYIGQTKNYKERFAAHKRKAFESYESSKILYQAFRKYGIENFSFEIIEYVENYNEREKYWIQKLNTISPNGYNMTIGGEEPPRFYGENHHYSQHSQKQVDEIIDLLLNTKILYNEIAKKYNYDISSIRRINVGEIWHKENLVYPLRPEHYKPFLEQQALNIIEDLQNTTLTQKEIAKKYNVGRTTVTAINNGQNHRQANLNYPIRKKPVKK